MMKFFSLGRSTWALSVAVGCVGLVQSAIAQETLPWQQRSGDGANYSRDNVAPRAAAPRRQQAVRPYQQAQNTAPDPYRAKPPVDRYNYGQAGGGYRAEAPVRPVPRHQARPQYGSQPAYPQRAQQGYVPPERQIRPYEPRHQRYGANAPYPRPGYGDDRYNTQRYDRGDERRVRMPDSHRGTYSENEVVDAGHQFFGSLSTGLAKAIQWAFKNSGRPNGYILGEDAGGAFVAGLRYGEGKLFTKNFGVHRVFWQGPSIGYDFGGDGNRTMTLVYNLRSPRDVFRRFGGVQGSAYLVGGASVQLLKAKDVTLAPIRTGVGLRLGANIGYLKFTRRPTWNPF